MTISIIIPTLNEEQTIGGQLESLSALAVEEIIVSDGGSRDHTPEIASAHARLVTGPPSRGLQLNLGAAVARGDVLLFLHADARLGPCAAEVVREAMADPLVVGGDFDVRYAGGDARAAAFTFINRARRRFGVFYGDSAIFCRRTVFLTLGGYQPWPLLEDYEFARRLRRHGRLALLDEPVFVSDRRWRNGGLLPTLAAWFFIQSLYLAGVSPLRLARLYRHVR